MMKDAIEAMIDRNTLAEVLGAIAWVCREKAEHIETNWQDRKLAREWEIVAKRIEDEQFNARSRNL